MKRFAVLAAIVAAVAIGSVTPASAVTANGCTVNAGSVELLPKPNFAKKPAVSWKITCITARQWQVTVQCQVRDATFEAWSQCGNTALTTFSGFSSGGSFEGLVGNGSWGCKNNRLYRGRLNLGGTWVSSCGSGCIGEIPTDAWKCS